MQLDFKTLVGEKASLYYTNLMNSFQLGSVLFEVLEDENDGYRSSMQEVKVVNQEAEKTQLLGEVEIKQADEDSFEGFELIDCGDGHKWLRFGTNNVDDYYPCFQFDWQVRPQPVAPAPNLFIDIKNKIK